MPSKIVVVASPLVALLNPGTDFAVIARSGVGTRLRCRDGSAHIARNATEVRHIATRRKRRLCVITEDDVHFVGKAPLHCLEELRVEAELEKRPALCFLRELGIDHFV